MFSLAKILQKYLLREEMCYGSIELHTQMAKPVPWIMKTHSILGTNLGV